MTVTDALREAGELELVGGPAYLALLEAEAATLAHFEDYGQIVRPDAAKREMIPILGEAIERAYNGSSPGELSERVTETLTKIAERAEHGATTEGTPVLLRLDDVQPEAVSWLWSGRFARGKLGLVIGEPGTGKTYLTTDMTARTTRRKSWPDGSASVRGPAIMFTIEDGTAHTVRPRVDRQGGDSGRVYVLRAVRVDGLEAPFSLERDLPALEKALIRTRAALVVIDPLSAYLGSKDSYKDSEIRGILAPLSVLAERLSMAAARNACTTATTLRWTRTRGTTLT